nr:hypothetical protein [Pseudodesulfovibrio sp.]
MRIDGIFTPFIFMVVFMLVAGIAHAAPGNQKKCPVMGFDVSRDLFTDYQARRIYFCCSACPGDFKKQPDFYMEKMRRDGVVLEEVSA